MVTRPSFINNLDFELLKSKLSDEQELLDAIEKVKDNYPIQYLIGNVDFLDMEILVNPNVLVPRFETELLVDKTIKYIKEKKLGYKIVDLCTGSGCIAIALKKHFINAEVYAYDKSFEALEVAKENAALNSTEINFCQEDVLSFYNYNDKIDVLISNPPYVKNGETVSENTKFEPQMALYAGLDDTIFYRSILENTKDKLADNFIIAFEIGATQAKTVCDYAKKIYPDAEISVEKDYNGYDRFVFIFKKSE